ncbi:MAG: glycosyltransferase family 2 protein [Planctomycetes bacterium]|nr:glycosyltransferase family 2 protein [Planctomycetota bacterium]
MSRAGALGSLDVSVRTDWKIAVVVPCYRARGQVLDVLARIGPECAAVYVVDDACPDGSGKHVQEHCRDARVRVLFHRENQGVGAATLSGYRAALADGAEVLVKLDADGQMDPALIPALVAPILVGEADYAKGNRFFDLEGLGSMPAVRLLGNSALSFLNKLSSGYWDVFDPTNGFTALHGAVARRLPLDKLARRYFFESDLLFRLGTLRAVVTDVPMPARYGAEKSGLSVKSALFEFAWKHLVNTVKRVFYGYYLRDFNFASLELVLGLLLVAGGSCFGLLQWRASSGSGVATNAGTVMLAALPVLLGVQLVLGFLAHDMHSAPRQVIHRRLGPPR